MSGCFILLDMSVYMNYRECLERARTSPLFVPCSRLVTKTYQAAYNEAEILTPSKAANMSCQYVG